MLFPADDLMRAVRARHEAALKESADLQAAAAEGTALSDEDRAALRQEFEQLRAEKGLTGPKKAPAANKAAAAADPFAALELGDGLLDTHASAIEKAVSAMKQQKAAAPTAPTQSAPTAGSSKLLGQLFA